MKRSEMINVLAEAINSQTYQDYMFDEEMLNNVLDAIEKAGMIPPGVPNLYGFTDEEGDVILNYWWEKE